MTWSDQVEIQDWAASYRASCHPHTHQPLISFPSWFSPTALSGYYCVCQTINTILPLYLTDCVTRVVFHSSHHMWIVFLNHVCYWYLMWWNTWVEKEEVISQYIYRKYHDQRSIKKNKKLNTRREKLCTYSNTGALCGRTGMMIVKNFYKFSLSHLI